jgi:hypothetical protein
LRRAATGGGGLPDFFFFLCEPVLFFREPGDLEPTLVLALGSAVAAVAAAATPFDGEASSMLGK